MIVASLTFNGPLNTNVTSKLNTTANISKKNLTLKNDIPVFIEIASESPSAGMFTISNDTSIAIAKADNIDPINHIINLEIYKSNSINIVTNLNFISYIIK